MTKVSPLLHYRVQRHCLKKRQPVVMTSKKVPPTELRCKVCSGTIHMNDVDLLSADFDLLLGHSSGPNIGAVTLGQD